MPRLFISPREIDFFNDIAKEITKDIVGQVIYYYPISIEKSDTHPVYEEAIRKVFENPIQIECLVEWNPSDITTTRFGHDATANISVWIQSRDMIEREIELREGDFFTYGSQIFEVTTVRTFRNIYGQVEFDDGIELRGKQARKDVFAVIAQGPTEESFSDDDAVQDTFKQQRGLTDTDERNLVENEVLEAPDITEPAEVSPRGTKSPSKAKSGFYGEGDC